MENNKSFELRIIENGPIQVTGSFSFKDSSGNVTIGRNEIFLCRCGGSGNKPYCDGTHKKIGVKD